VGSILVDRPKCQPRCLRRQPPLMVSMVDKPVEHGGGHLGITENGRPLAERQVQGDDHRVALAELADEVEQQLAT
jgi:hypothetical protein